MKKIYVLGRNPQNEELELQRTTYDGNVPPRVFAYLNRFTRRLSAQGFFYPCDALDAYNSAFLEVGLQADRIAGGEITLLTATPTTYLKGVARQALTNYHFHEVLPRRDEYRRVAAQQAKDAMCDAVSDEANLDVDDPIECDVAGTLPWERRLKAALALEEIFTRMTDKQAVEAFRAFLLSEGDRRRAAYHMGIPEATFYRRWPHWLAAARAAARDVNI